MNVCSLTFQLRFELFARSLSGKRTNKRAQTVFVGRVDRTIRVSASARSMFSPSLAPLPSSFAHDTPAHLERRCRFTPRSAWLGSTECGSERIDN